jgi:acylphosphatase
MTNDSQAQRAIVHYSGRVQGVGFRYTARSIAGKYDVAGYVQNLSDGRVRLVVDGKQGEIDRFLAEVADRMNGYIHDAQVHRSAATGEFAGFTIEH